MTVKDYFELIGYDRKCCKQVFFVQAKCYEEGSHKEFRYRTTPLRTVAEWWEFYDERHEYQHTCLTDLVLNTEAYGHDWLSGACWNAQVKNHNYHGILTVSREELEKYYNPKQADEIIGFIDEQIFKNNGK